MPGRGHQCASFLDRRCLIDLIADPFGQLLLRRGKLRERIDEAADHHRRHILDDIHQHRLVQHQVHSAAYPRIVERFFLVVDPGRVHHALVMGVGRNLRHRLGLTERDRIRREDIVDPVRKYC